MSAGIFFSLAIATALGVLFVGFVSLLALRILSKILLSAALVPRKAPAAVRPGCNVPSDLATDQIIDSALTDGVIRSPQVSIPQGTTLRLTGDLIIVSDGDLVIDGSILNAVPQSPMPPAATPFSMNITLVSLNGNVRIGRTARIGFDTATAMPAPPIPTGSVNLGVPGRTGGWIKIVSPLGSVENAGTIIGMPGTRGADADHTAGLPTAHAIASGQVGAAQCAAGSGGDGGNVALCAVESIVNTGSIDAGDAGAGGLAIAASALRGLATSQGGTGGTGGNVVLHGLAGAAVPVSNSGAMIGGLGGPGGAAIANGGNLGADARARGGDAGKGGTVEFAGVLMAAVGTLAPASGGSGGVATANGGFGGALLGNGLRGGDALARGGDGASDGPTGPIPLLPGAQPTGWGTAVTSPPLIVGAGGNATAAAGGGGNGNGFTGGGSSGRPTAKGGTGKSLRPVPPVTLAPAGAGAGGVGGVIGPLLSPGTP